ncbi:unnamed protein product [Prunus armeniaca]
MQLFADFSYWHRVKVAGGSFADFLEKATDVLTGGYKSGGLNHLLDNWFCIVMVLLRGIGGEEVDDLVLDCHGEFCCCFAAVGSDGFDILGIELGAIRSGLLLAVVKGMVYLTVASNSQEAVNMINGTNGWLSNVGNLVDDIQMLLVQLGNAKVVYQSYEGNSMAHAMAQFRIREGNQFF